MVSVKSAARRQAWYNQEDGGGKTYNLFGRLHSNPRGASDEEDERGSRPTMSVLIDKFDSTKTARKYDQVQEVEANRIKAITHRKEQVEKEGQFHEFSSHALEQASKSGYQLQCKSVPIEHALRKVSSVHSMVCDTDCLPDSTSYVDVLSDHRKPYLPSAKSLATLDDAAPLNIFSRCCKRVVSFLQSVSSPKGSCNIVGSYPSLWSTLRSKITVTGPEQLTGAHSFRSAIKSLATIFVRASKLFRAQSFGLVQASLFAKAMGAPIQNASGSSSTASSWVLRGFCIAPVGLGLINCCSTWGKPQTKEARQLLAVMALMASAVWTFLADNHVAPQLQMLLLALSWGLGSNFVMRLCMDLEGRALPRVAWAIFVGFLVVAWLLNSLFADTHNGQAETLLPSRAKSLADMALIGAEQLLYSPFWFMIWAVLVKLGFYRGHCVVRIPSRMSEFWERCAHRISSSLGRRANGRRNVANGHNNSEETSETILQDLPPCQIAAHNAVNEQIDGGNEISASGDLGVREPM